MSVTTPVPVSESVLCTFVTYLAEEKLTHRTIKTYLSAVRFLQIRKGYPDPFQGSAMPRPEYVLKGVKRVQAKTGVEGEKPRLPITPHILRLLKGVWSSQGTNYDTK